MAHAMIQAAEPDTSEISMARRMRLVERMGILILGAAFSWLVLELIDLASAALHAGAWRF